MTNEYNPLGQYRLTPEEMREGAESIIAATGEGSLLVLDGEYAAQFKTYLEPSYKVKILGPSPDFDQAHLGMNFFRVNISRRRQNA